ncbi:hypothetical protein Pst134EA_031594 [Puccinia striiformis f. sp. tritici]|uniref:Tc1-like transposase DDE domain-containing protein n=1 Tax=Puccinia striiformis f. sp. tritici PST-78 TaxID=1165861 RepID=A0A0L0V6R5_9BASI|nr:uncharacterized protein Pst134EA_031594 [Puccinia striiformis f. sp. tritici]KAH9445223.1 hypothetical protein Pst134EA_031594 [Puccinia striiformis f. sp. tritici]KNE94957.1 hypothetical protein PSTG_11748 [Puccinia striiformis f. sp. tritici PST-78]
MDNAPVHQGERFKEVIGSLKIKAYVRSKQPPNRAALVKEIKRAIPETITPEKSKKFFSHCQRLYRPCAEFGQITGAVLTALPED